MEKVYRIIKQTSKRHERVFMESRILPMCIRETSVILGLFSALTRERWSILISGFIRFFGTFIISEVL